MNDSLPSSLLTVVNFFLCLLGIDNGSYVAFQVAL